MKDGASRTWMDVRWRRWTRRAGLAVAAVIVRGRVRRLRRRNASLPGILAVLERPGLGSRLLSLQPTTDDAWVVVDRLFVREASNRCLIRSLVLFGLLQDSPAQDVRFCLGVRPEAVRTKDTSPLPSPDAPFAHAWVEAGGEPVGEPADPQVTHRLIYSYPDA